MNKLLQRQLQKHLVQPDKMPENFARLLHVISESYDHYEKDRKLMERSIELSSKEMIELNTQVKKSGKDELQKAHSQLKMLFENIEEILYTVDMVSLKLVQISEVCEKVYGYTQEEFLADGDLWQKVILPEDLDIVHRHVKELYEGKQVTGQYRIIHKDKSIRWLESKIIPTMDKNGQLIRMDGVTNDITERKQAQKKLEASVSMLEATFESTADGILVVDLNARLVRFNSKFIELWGVPPEILNTGSDETAIAFVSAQLINPEEFIAKIKELNTREKEISFDTLQFKDGRVFERYSQPQVINGNYVGRVWSFRDITQRKIAEDKISKSEFRYRSLIEDATDAICITDASLKFYDMNPSGCKMLGYSKEEFLQLSIADLFFIEDLQANPFKIDDLQAGKPISSVRRFKRKDGVILEIDLSGKLMEDGRFIMFGRDVSERKVAERLMQESELRYRSLIEQATDAIIIADLSMQFRDINPSGCEMLGYTKEEFTQLSIADVLPAEDLKTNPFQIERLKSGLTIRNERRIIRKDGSMGEMEVSGKIMTDGRFIIFGHDISERKKSEKALIESELRLRQIIDLVPHFIFAKDAEGKFILANESVAKAYGSTVEDLIGKTDADFNSRNEEVEHFMEEDRKVITSGNVKYNIEETITDADGNLRILSTTKIPYTSPGLETPGVLGVAVDISERKKAEIILKESEGQLSAAAQIAKLGYWEFDVALNQFKFNDQFYSIFKTTVEEVGGYTMSSERYAELFVHPDDFSIVTQAAAETIKSPDPHFNKQIEHRVKYANGETGYMASRFFIVKNKAGRTVKTFGAIQDISESKNAESILKQSEGRLAIAADIAKLGYWEYDVAENLFTFNDQFYAIFRTTAEKAGGTSMSAARYAELFMHPDDQDVVAVEVGNAINSSDPHFSRQIEHRIIYADGEIGYVSVHFYIVKDDKGRTIKTFGVNQDITERKKTEEALSNNELRFRTLAGSAPVGIFQSNSEGKTIYVNERFLEYTGLTFEESMGDGWIQAIHPDDREMVLNGWDDSLTKDTDPSAEYRLVDKKGNIRWVIGQAVRIFNKNGLKSGYIGTMSDITERKLAIESLQQSETKYRQIVETAQEGIWLIDENNLTTLVNKKMADLLEYSVEEMLGKKNYCFMDEEWKKKATANIGDRKLGKSEIHDFKYVTKSRKEVWTTISTNPVFDDAGEYKGALAMVSDSTQRRLDEELIRKSELTLASKNKELEHKNTELEHFAYIASHDLQEPLRTTTSFVDLLEQQYKGKLDQKADKYLRFIGDSAARMKVLITDLLEYSRIGTKKQLQPVDCNMVVTEVLQDLGAVIKETGAKINMDILPVIGSYRTEIKQLFQNLIVNAIKFRKKDSLPEINISVQEDDVNWTFAVRDNGIGIAEDQKDRIFVIFQRLHTRTEYEGSGIGLAHCKKIVGLHGGEIWIESTPGNGTTFYFNIPKIYN